MPSKLVIPKEAKLKNLPKPLELVKPWSGTPPRSMIIDSDDHYGLHNKKFQEAKLKFAEDQGGIDCWFNLGDHYDFGSLSSFLKDPRLPYSLQDEFDASESYWKRVCSAAQRVEYILGNHEYRLFKTIQANQGFFGLRSLSNWHQLAGIPTKVVVHEYGTLRQIGLVGGEHGDQIRGQNPVLWAMNNRNWRVTVFGHTHHMGSYYRTCLNERGEIVTREAHNTGYGQDPRTAPWAGAVPNWQPGFLYAEHFRTSTGWDVSIHPIRVSNGKFMFRGRTYSA
jgi:predicted phosphodiesterase